MVIATAIPLCLITGSFAAFAMLLVRMQQNHTKVGGLLAVSENIIHSINCVCVKQSILSPWNSECSFTNLYINGIQPGVHEDILGGT
jgi:hypothetical protein